MSCIAPLWTPCAMRKASSVWARTSTIALPITSTSIWSCSMLGNASSRGWRAFASAPVMVKRSRGSKNGLFRTSRSAALPAQANVDGARSAVMRKRFLESEHERAQLRHAKPVRDGQAEHATFLEQEMARGGGALARDDEHEAMPGVLSTVQKTDECAMRFRLPHPVQVDHALDFTPASTQGHQRPALDGGKGRYRQLGWARISGAP